MVRGIKTRFTFNSASDLAPVWSPDDTRIVWRAERENGERGLFVKRTDVADTALLIASMSDLFWPWTFTNDGTEVIYSFLDKDGKADLWIVSSDGSGEPRRLIDSDFDEWGATISPDGRWMAYGSNETGKPQIYVTPFPNPTSKWQVTADGGLRSRWSPAGDRLYFFDLNDSMQSAEVDGGGNVFRIGSGSIETLFKTNPGNSTFELMDSDNKFLINYSPEKSSPSQMILVQHWQEELKN
jgi:Tol biopolymer transport system component